MGWGRSPCFCTVPFTVQRPRCSRPWTAPPRPATTSSSTRAARGTGGTSSPRTGPPSARSRCSPSSSTTSSKVLPLPIASYRAYIFLVLCISRPLSAGILDEDINENDSSATKKAKIFYKSCMDLGESRSRRPEVRRDRDRAAPGSAASCHSCCEEDGVAGEMRINIACERQNLISGRRSRRGRGQGRPAGRGG